MTRKEEIDKEANSFANTVSIGEEEIAKNWSAFITGAEWADRTMLDKACEWLSKHAKKYYFNKDGHYLGTDELVEDFKLSMEL